MHVFAIEQLNLRSFEHVITNYDLRYAFYSEHDYWLTMSYFGIRFGNISDIFPVRVYLNMFQSDLFQGI